MKNAVRLLLAFAVVAVLAVVFLRTLEVRPTPAEKSAPAPTPALTSSTPATPASAIEESGAPGPAPAPESESAPAGGPPLLVGEAAHEAISDLAVTYDAASVPDLARYLAHADAEIRAAAREGLVQLGERAAIPFLEDAAKKAPDAEEARALREAAEFLALPTWTERRRAQREAAQAPK